jgi:hypothetical protein
MATFYYNRFSNENIHSQWMRHLQNNAYVKDVDYIVSQNRREFEKTIENASDEQKKAIQQVCGTLEDGFKEIRQHLRYINFNIAELRGEINEMASMLDWKLSLMIEEQRLTNHLLEKITELQRIPESQKQKVYYIEEGLKYLKNSIIEGVDSEYYSMAYKNFTEAEKINEDDYITLNKIGQIYLYSKKYLNVPLAKKYFLKSAREAFAEANVGGTPTSKYLRPFGQQPLIYSQNPYKVATAEAYLYAGRACYLQQETSEAAELAGKAYNLVPEFLEAGFEQAKYLAANNQDDEAARVLETVIAKDRYFSITALQEEDFKDKPHILKLIQKLCVEATTKATVEFLECKNIMKVESKATTVMNKIHQFVLKCDYLSSLKALDLLHADYQLPYLRNDRDGERINVVTLTTSQKLMAFIKAENHSDKHFLELKNEAKKEIVNDRKIFGGLWGGGIGFVVGFFKGCTVHDFSMNSGTWLATTVGFAVIGMIIGAIIGASTEPTINKM